MRSESDKEAKKPIKLINSRTKKLVQIKIDFKERM